MSRGYYSSHDKDIIRRHFDLPLLHQLHRRKRHRLNYFGLPGAEALDIRTWREVLGHVVAVERDSKNLRKLEQLLDTQLPEIGHTTHWGELDDVILRNKGKGRDIGGQHHHPFVGNSYENSIRGYVWRFDVVYLDYFGPFLPQKTKDGATRARKRSDALRHLFVKDRVDAWQQWVLLVTSEAQLRDRTTLSLIQEYLRSTRKESSTQFRGAVDFLLSNAPTSYEEAARLIHGTAAILVSEAASNANLKVQPRGSVLYRGAGNQHMVHLAFEFNPNRAPLGQVAGRLPLLLAPILKPKDPRGSPWVELLPEQCPGVTRESAAGCLDFFEKNQVAEIVGNLPSK